MTIPSLIKKQKGSKRNGGSSKYTIVNKASLSNFIDSLFHETNWYYLTIIFNGKGYKVNMILWKDEADLLKLMLALPFKYRIYPVSKTNPHPCLEIKFDTVPDSVKGAYETMNSGDLCEYYKQAIKGY